MSKFPFTALAIFCATFAVFFWSPVHQVTDSHYSMLVSQSLIEHGSFRLDDYALPLLPPQDRGYYTSNGPYYQLELIGGHVLYHLPPGSSVLSVPYVALMRMIGIRATNDDGTYNPLGEEAIEVSLAALLMAALAVVFFYTARLRLTAGWSLVVAAGATLGTQVWSTASRALWSDTWSLLLMGLVIFMLLAHETGRSTLKPILVASLLAWTYFVRPTNAVPILALSGYVFVFHRRLFLTYAATGALWAAGFFLYSWHYFGEWLPSYYRASRLNSDLFWTALPGNLISPARGVLVYVPWLIFVGYLLARYWSQVRLRPLVVVALVIVAGHLLAISRFPHWWGGASFGPRLMTGLCPWFTLLAVLGIEAWLVKAASSSRWRMESMVGTALLALGIAINARGACSPGTWLWNGHPRQVDEHPDRLWDWREPQFLAGWVSPSLPREFPLLAGRIDFSTAAADPYLWYGWSGREEHIRWTEGKKAALFFESKAGSDLEFEMRFCPFLPKGLISRQRVTIALNGSVVGTLVLEDEQVIEYKALLSGKLLRDKNRLVFSLPDATSPKKLGVSNDARILGLAVFWLQLQPHDILRDEESAP